MWNWLVQRTKKQSESVNAAKKGARCARTAAVAMGTMEMKQLLPLVSTKSCRVISF